MTRWHDQTSRYHLLRGNGAPACGVRYYTSAGVDHTAPDHNKCLRCLRIEAKRKKET